MAPPITRGFFGRRRREPDVDLPPGQHVVGDFPVFTAGPTPRTPLDEWSLVVSGTGIGEIRRWSWSEFQALPHEDVETDIHCVTTWSKLGTRWRGVSLDTLVDGAAPGPFVVARCDGGYTTNLPTQDVLGGRAWIVDAFDGAPLPPDHGAPARLLVPHLYLWKSAKWVRELVFGEHDELGFWEVRGYHEYGDPWREQRYAGD